MRLNSLQLVNFRNYNNLYLEFNKKVNLLLGKNGQGKTNIVESIYMLSFGKSFTVWSIKIGISYIALFPLF